MCSIIPEAWYIHTVIVMFQHELFIHSVAALQLLVRHCASLPLFTYYLANRRMVSHLLNSTFKLKEQTICNVYSIIPEAWNIQACKCFTVLWHTRGDTAAWKNTRECSGNRVVILDLFFAISRFNS